MIVKNEAHVIRETLDSIAPYISSWVIVDTGSDDGTQELIRHHMAQLEIPGELYERPWRDFGYNRTEAMTLASGYGDYIWVHDADDVLIGTPDFGELTADAYRLRYRLPGGISSWRIQLFRSGRDWRWEGVVYESPVVEHEHLTECLEGEYYIDYRQTGSRSRDPKKYAHDAALLLAEVERNPSDITLMSALVGAYTNSADHVNVLTWAPRAINAIKLSGTADIRSEDMYELVMQLANSMTFLNESWSNVENVWLAAWKLRPIRAEPLYVIAHHYRTSGNYDRGYLFAKRAAEMAFPAGDRFVDRGVYAWQATDEQAICALSLGRHAEAFALNRELIATAEVPEAERQRISADRDRSVPTMIEAASSYPETVVAGLTTRTPELDVTVSLAVGPDCNGVEETLNSFLHCCLDADRIGRFVILNSGLAADDHDRLHRQYPFLEFIDCAGVPETSLTQLRGHITGRFWLHLDPGSLFFAPDNFITRLSGVLDAEPDIPQVAVNHTGATRLTGTCALEETVRRTPQAGRYTLTDTTVRGPIMYHTTRIHRAGQRTATLDEILCIQRSPTPGAFPSSASDPPLDP